MAGGNWFLVVVDRRESFLVLALFTFVAAAAFFHQSDFMKDKYHKHSVVGLYLGMPGAGLVLTGVAYGAHRSKIYWEGNRAAKVAIKVGAYSVSAGVYFFTFRIYEKSRYIDHHMSHEYGLKYDKPKDFLFMNYMTVLCTFALAAACFFIILSMEGKNELMDWIFDFMCDLTVHMGADVCGKKVGYGILFFAGTVILIALKERFGPQDASAAQAGPAHGGAVAGAEGQEMQNAHPP